MTAIRKSSPLVAALLLTLPAVVDQLPPDASYRPLPTQPLATVRMEDEAAKPEVMRQQQQLFEQRFDLSNRPMPGEMMSGGQKPVQGGVRIKLPEGVTWHSLAQMTPDQIRDQGMLPAGFVPLPLSNRPRAGRCSRTPKSTKSTDRRTATCDALTSISTSLTSSRRSFRRRSI